MCFGRSWTKDSEACLCCLVVGNCLHDMGVDHLDELTEKMGKRPSAADLVKYWGVTEETAREVLAFRERIESREELDQRGSWSAVADNYAGIIGGTVGRDFSPEQRGPRSEGRKTWCYPLLQFRSRWERERERCPYLRELEPGEWLIAGRKAKHAGCKVLECGYEYQGFRFPTLYAVMGWMLRYTDPECKRMTPQQYRPALFFSRVGELRRDYYRNK